MLGLAGLEFLDAQFAVIPVGPRDLAVAGDGVDADAAQALVNGNNVTQDPAEMWLCDVGDGADGAVRVRVDFGGVKAVGGLKVWNFNTSVEESYLGVKRMDVLLDGMAVSPPAGFLIRKAPGGEGFDFGQFIAFGGQGKEGKEGDGGEALEVNSIVGSSSVEDLWDEGASPSRSSPSR